MAVGDRSAAPALSPQIALLVQTLVPQRALLEARVLVPQIAFRPQSRLRLVMPVPQSAFVPQSAVLILMFTLPELSSEREGLWAYMVGVTAQFRAAGMFRYPAPKVQASAVPFGKPHLSAENISRALSTSGVRLELACSSSAAAPATTGAAIEVPDRLK